MMSNPRVGVRVVLHYSPKRRCIFPHHGKAGAVVVVGTGTPRNHLVQLDGGPRVVVSAGNLKPEGS